MSSWIFRCCWPFFQSEPKSTSAAHEDKPLIVTASKPQKRLLNEVLYNTSLEEDDFKNVSLKSPKHKLFDGSDGKAADHLNVKFTTLNEDDSDSDEWMMPSQKKSPLWQQLETIKSPAHGRPPNCN